jgi:DNA-binding transcriptional LysR family regulator
MDRFSCLTAFVSVVDKGGFSAAARHLNLSPSTVTRMIQIQEERVGARLVNRTTRQCRVTEAGQVLYERCRAVLEELKAAEVAASELHAAPHGTVSLNTSPILADFVSALIADYLDGHASTNFELTVTDRMGGLVEDGFDLAIRADPLADSSMITRRLGQLPLGLYASPGYLARRGQVLRPADLTRHNCLVCPLAWSDGEWTFEGAGGSHTVAVSGNVRCNDLGVLRAMALACQGIAILPDTTDAGRLVRLLSDYTIKSAPVNVLFSSGRLLSRKVRNFVDFAAARCDAVSAVPDAAGAPRSRDTAMTRFPLAEAA